MKVKSTITRLLTNRTVLNVVFVIALLNIIGYLMIGSYHEIVQFILVALLTSYFSKNMIVVLGVPMVIVNLFARMNTMREGLEGNGNAAPPVAKKPKKPDTVAADGEKPKTGVNNIIKYFISKIGLQNNNLLIIMPLNTFLFVLLV